MNAQLDILRTFIAALTHSGMSPLSLVAVGAHLDQLQAAAATLADHPTLAVAELQNGEAT